MSNHRFLSFIIKSFFIGLTICFIGVFIVQYVQKNSQRSKADELRGWPHDVWVDWQRTPTTTTSTSPIITWTLPTDNQDQIVAVVVRMRTTANGDAFYKGCADQVPGSDILDHWFYKASFNPPGARLSCEGQSNNTITYFNDEIPTEYVVPQGVLSGPGQVFFNIWTIRFANGNYIWSNVHTDIQNFTYQPASKPLSYNPFGIGVYQYYLDHDRPVNEDWKNHLTWTRNLTGENGFAKLYFPYIGFNPPVERYHQVLQETYQRGLNAVVRLQGKWSEGVWFQNGGCMLRPPSNGGDYSAYAQQLADFVGGLPPPPGGKPLYIEVWNEPNYGENWCDESNHQIEGGNAEEYVKFYVETYDRITNLNKPYIKIMPGGIGTAGYRNFEKRMLAQLILLRGPSQITHYFENWATHVYPHAHVQEGTNPANPKGIPVQPIGDIGPYKFGWSPVIYKDQVELLRQYSSDHDVSNVKVFITEGGFVVNPNVGSPDLPTMSRLNQAIMSIWASDPKVVAFMPFALDSPDDPYWFGPGWIETGAWVKPGSGTANGLPSDPNPVYTASRALISTYVNNTPYNLPSSQTPKGYVVYESGQTCSAIVGWSCDLDKPDAALRVDLHDFADPAHTIYIGSATANTSRFNGPDLRNACRGTEGHGWEFNFDSSGINLRDGGVHKIRAFGINIDPQGVVQSGGHGQLNSIPSDGNNEVVVYCPLPTAIPNVTPTAIPTLPPAVTPTPAPVIVSCNEGCDALHLCSARYTCVSGVCRNPSCTGEASCTCAVAPTATPTPFVIQVTDTPVPTQIICRKSEGDADCDGAIRISDFAVWRSAYANDTYDAAADFNSDGKINLIDFEIFRRHLGD